MANKKIFHHYSDDEKFIPSFRMIKEKVKHVFSRYNIDKVYLYGSYAKGT